MEQLLKTNTRSGKTDSIKVNHQQFVVAPKLKINSAKLYPKNKKMPGKDLIQLQLKGSADTAP